MLPYFSVSKYLTWHHSRSIALVRDLTRITALCRDQDIDKVVTGVMMSPYTARNTSVE